MPFDGTPVNIYALRRARLIEALRSEMPTNFKWNFSKVLEQSPGCGYAGCAMGLMTIEFPDFEIGNTTTVRVYDRVADYLGISNATAQRCFSYVGWNGTPTAKQVANRLENLTKDLPAV